MPLRKNNRVDISRYAATANPSAAPLRRMMAALQRTRTLPPVSVRRVGPWSGDRSLAVTPRINLGARGPGGAPIRGGDPLEPARLPRPVGSTAPSLRPSAAGVDAAQDETEFSPPQERGEAEVRTGLPAMSARGWTGREASPPRPRQPVRRVLRFAGSPPAGFYFAAQQAASADALRGDPAAPTSEPAGVGTDQQVNQTRPLRRLSPAFVARGAGMPHVEAIRNASVRANPGGVNSPGASAAGNDGLVRAGRDLSKAGQGLTKAVDRILNGPPLTVVGLA